MVKHIANILTGCRILGSILLLFFPAFSLAFYILYLLCGFSDMIDGAVARKTNSTSQFGSRLDTIADLVFAVAAMIRLLPAIHLPGWLWIWGGVIAMIKLTNIVWGLVCGKKLVAYHTVCNKATGLLLFLLPLTLQLIEPTYSFVCDAQSVCQLQLRQVCPFSAHSNKSSDFNLIHKVPPFAFSIEKSGEKLHLPAV